MFVRTGTPGAYDRNTDPPDRGGLHTEDTAMTRLVTTAAATLLGLAALAPAAPAQVVIGTRPSYYAPGTVVTPYGVVNPNANLAGGVYTSGYYSPYPGYVYSPFVNNYSAGYGYGSGYNVYNYRYGSGFYNGGTPGHTPYYAAPPGSVLYGRPMVSRYYR